SDFFGGFGVESVDATNGSIDGRFIFTVAINDVETNIVFMDDDVSTFTMPIWIQTNSTGRTLPANAIAWFEDSSSSRNVYITTGNTNSSGLFFGDTNSDAQGGLFYDHNTDNLSVSANATNFIHMGANMTSLTAFMLIDSGQTTVSYGDVKWDSGVAGTPASVDFIIEDDGNTEMALVGTSVTVQAYRFIDDAVGGSDVSGIFYAHSTGGMTLNAETTVVVGSSDFEVTAGDTEFNSDEDDHNFIVNGNSLSDAFFLEGFNGFVGLNTNAPGQNIAGGTTDQSDVNTILHVKDTGQATVIINEGALGAFLDSVDLGGGANDKVLRFATDGGVGKFSSLNDDLTVRVSHLMSMDMGTGFTAIGDDSTALGMLHVE
ncbi:hypothetical protein LCGC14_2960080, partial [marine sediment metagenome]